MIMAPVVTQTIRSILATSSHRPVDVSELLQILLAKHRILVLIASTMEWIHPRH